MQEFYFSERRLDVGEVAKISQDTGGQFGFTGLETVKGLQYSLILSGDTIPDVCETILKLYGLHK